MVAVRSSGALWIVPLLFALGSIASVLNEFQRTGYVASDLSSAGIALCYSGPLLAGFAAFSFRGRARFHRTLRSNRTGLRSLLATGWPLILGAPVAGCVAVMITARAAPTDAVAWQLIAVDFAVLLACALVGVGLTWALPVVVAIPGSVILCFLWINYLPGTSSAVMHNMSPTFDGFSQTSRPAVSGIVAVLILTGTVGLGVAVCVGRRSWDRTPRLLAVPMVVATLVVAVTLSAGSLWASSASLNLMVVEPRTTPLTCTSEQDIDVCLWPEGRGRAAEVAGIAASMNDVLTTWGLPEIDAVGQGGLRADAIDVESSKQLGTRGLHLSVARGYLRQRIGCQDDGGGTATQRVLALLMASGVPAEALAGEAPPEIVAEVSRVLQSAPKEVGQWYAEGATEIRCVPGT